MYCDCILKRVIMTCYTIIGILYMQARQLLIENKETQCNTFSHLLFDKSNVKIQK